MNMLTTKSVIDDLEAMDPEESKAILTEMLDSGMDANGKWHQPEGWLGPDKPNPWADLRPIDLNRSKRISDTLAIVSMIAGILAIIALVLYFAPQIDAWTPLQ
jgi:hypothetical protein